MLRALLIAGLAAGQGAQAEDWHQTSDEGGLRVEVRDLVGSSFEEIRVTARTPVSPARACGAIWARNVKEGEPGFRKRELLRETATDRWTYEQVAVPLVNDRDYTIHVWGEKPDPAGCLVHFDLDNARGPAPKEGVVRMPALRGSWVVTATAEGGTQVVYTLFNDPGGNVPAFVSRGTQRTKTVEFVRLILARASRAIAPDAGG